MKTMEGILHIYNNICKTLPTIIYTKIFIFVCTHIYRYIHTSMAQSNTAATPMLTHWSYRSPAPSHRYGTYFSLGHTTIHSWTTTMFNSLKLKSCIYEHITKSRSRSECLYGIIKKTRVHLESMGWTSPSDNELKVFLISCLNVEKAQF